MWAQLSLARTQAADFIELTKPRIALVALFTAFAGLWLAAGPGLPPGLAAAALIGTGLAAAAAAVLNNYLDRDIDRLMSRTADRALAAGRMPPQTALTYGLALAGAAFLVLAAGTNLFAAALAMGAIYFYAVVYTLWLKRRTDLCTEIGGIAGALPPVIGWAAATGAVEWPAMLLFLLLFVWQPPHFWVLAMLRADEYRRAGIPMLPVTAGPLATRMKILLYTAALFPCVLALFFAAGLGRGFLFIGGGATLAYLALTIDFVRRPLMDAAGRRRAIRLFLFSIAWVLLVFTAILIDSH